ncbi:HNH endonuclease [Emcibacter sp.]|uniref:HNH endonuclease n=1 Tax=Emcibacter sp. TaxID=1979954 RepID=UPI002AA862A6|nr:HNH endonuclease [Emcibacter sp.]
MSNSRGRPWTREELILAINLYCQIPFGQIHTGNNEIKKLAEKLGRTPGSISYKLANFASIDPSLDREGAKNTSKLDREVWNEFFHNWDEMILQSVARADAIELPSQGFGESPAPEFQYGTDVERTVAVRANQNIFRRMILSSYDERCCITGIKNTELLVASHIVPWSKDNQNRLNPMNGLCLNALHDKAFDKGLITLGEKYEVIVSRKLSHQFFKEYENQPILLPRRFLPDQEFLEFHRTNVYEKANALN